MQLDLITVTQFKWTVEYVGDWEYQESGWVDEGFYGYFAISTEPPANSTTRYIFSHWSGNVTGTDSEASSAILFTGPVWIYALWVTQYYITVVTDYSSSISSGWYNKSLTISVSIEDEHVSVTSDSRWAFTEWSGDTTGTDYSASDSFLVDSAKTINANWIFQYLLTINSDYGTISGAGWYNTGATAYAALNTSMMSEGTGTRFVFQNWSGDGTGTNYAISNPIIMNSPKIVLAVWQTQFSLTITSPYGSVSGDGWYANGTIAFATLTTGLISGITGVQYVFDSWTDDATGNDYTQSNAISMDAPKTATALWSTEYYLTIISSYGTPSGSGWYVSGSTANAELDTDIVSGVDGERFVFQNWADDATGTDYTLSENILMDAPKTATAVWCTQYYLTVVSSYGTPSGEGWYNSTLIAHAELDTDTVAGTDGERFVFINWTGDTSGTAYSQSDAILMDGPKTATANWKTQYHLTCATNPSGLSPSPTITPSGEWFDDGTVLLLTAIEISGYNFTHWAIDGIDSDDGVVSIALLMNKAHEATAYYQATETTSTTTNTETLPSPDSTMLLVIAGAAGAVLVIAILLIVMKKKKS